jgi:hypothetical protein
MSDCQLDFLGTLLFFLPSLPGRYSLFWLAETNSSLPRPLGIPTRKHHKDFQLTVVLGPLQACMHFQAY